MIRDFRRSPSLRVVVMAGGRGRRLRRAGREKPLLAVDGSPLLVRVVNSLELAGWHRPLIATSPHTPRTEILARELGCPVIRTPGVGYPQDVGWLLRRYPRLLTVCADLPFLDPAVLRNFGRQAKRASRSFAAVAPRRKTPRDPPGALRFVGLNFVCRAGRKEGPLFPIRDFWSAVNVNTLTDLRRARSLAVLWRRLYPAVDRHLKRRERGPVPSRSSGGEEIQRTVSVLGGPGALRLPPGWRASKGPGRFCGASRAQRRSPRPPRSKDKRPRRPGRSRG